MYSFDSREKEFPHVKNVTAQAWAFKSTLQIINAGDRDLIGWKVFVGFQNREVLVTADGATLSTGDDLPAMVGNGTTLAGYPNSDLKNSVETAGDWTQIAATVPLSGTQFGMKPPKVPLPKTIRLVDPSYKCPAPVKHKTEMHVCCTKNPKFKPKKDQEKKVKFSPRQDGDLVITYDVTSSFEGKYMALVTMENNHPLGRLDSWNLTWEWKRGEFIYSMKGAFTHRKDSTDCIFGPQGEYYQAFDFTPVQNCERRPIISDLPPDRAKDDVIGNVPHCCRNGSLLPSTMDASKSKAAFELQVFKMPPDMNRTALTPPANWKIKGVVNPEYKCAPPIRVSPSEYPDPTGLDSRSNAVASWQIVCNITRPKKRQSRCCVSYSAYYNDSVIPCNTCACGCPEEATCNQDAAAMLLPPEALLVPHDNRTAKAKAWAKIHHRPVPRRLPCGDNCGVSINWHVLSDYRKGWTARVTIFNWGEYIFQDWFAAIQMPKAYRGFENVYSFNGTRMPELNNTIFFQGLLGLNYLIGERNGTNPLVDPPVPGKQQSVISFSKKRTPGIKIAKGEGFPTRVYFNGEECELPLHIPQSGAHATTTTSSSRSNLVFALLPSLVKRSGSTKERIKEPIDGGAAAGIC
ncbi:hypothetical protein H6P81_007035 [Aristolochia fimbriata]|uniref:COBRA C-terminal domain-containing protein n=1 Tax=Aristolochia fimbriata TaxID=158543 RepID=A0AAV7F075_ARIFI|nr:hypothetical protein H6P81_007035 [Aristolochia fimbriata]